jgi:hypothetical protein
VKQYITQNPKHFKTYAYLSLQSGDVIDTEAGRRPFVVPAGSKVEDKELKMIERPERCPSAKGAWLVDQDRLFSVLKAMISGVPLPPVQVEATESGALRVANGFHRYYASVLLGYTEIPVLCSGHEQSSKNLEPEWKDCRRSSSKPIFLEEAREDGTTKCLEAVVVAPKKDVAPTHKPKEHEVEPKKWEPLRVRAEKERIRQEEQKRKEQQQAVEELWKKATSKEANDSDLCHRMRRPTISYAEKTMGRKKAGEPPKWDKESAL